MYTFSKRLKITSLVLIIIGAIGWISSYNSSHHLTLEDVKVLLADEEAHHGVSEVHDDGEAHAAMIHSASEDGHHHEEAHHDDEHAEHVLHQMHNRPYAALYVAAFFFMMISLGVLAFYGIQYAAQAGW